jgi:hypothetical protein
MQDQVLRSVNRKEKDNKLSTKKLSIAGTAGSADHGAREQSCSEIKSSFTTIKELDKQSRQ